MKQTLVNYCESMHGKQPVSAFWPAIITSESIRDNIPWVFRT
jgi:hypothetical protein